MKETPLWALDIFSSWERNPEATLQNFSSEALSRVGSDDIAQGYLLYLDKVKDVFISSLRVSGPQLKALREFPAQSTSGSLISILHDPSFDAYISNYIQSIEYALDRTCFAPESSRIWLLYYDVITALESCPWRHQSTCIALRKDLLQCICKRIVLDNNSVFTSIFQDRGSADMGQPISGAELYNTHNKVIAMAKNIERAQAYSAYSLAEVFQVIAHKDEKSVRSTKHIENNPLAVYHAFIGLFDEAISFCATNDISDRITGRILYCFYESALYYLGRSLPAIFLDIAIRISGHVISPSIVQDLFQRSMSETIFGHPTQIKKPFEDATDLACNILQRGVAMHPKVTLLYVSLMELLKHRSLEQHGSAIIAQLYDELLRKDLEETHTIAQQAFVAVKYILRYTLETSGVTAMIRQTWFILQHKAVPEHELWDAVLYILDAYFGDAQAFTVTVSDYQCLGDSIIGYITRGLHRSVKLLQHLWHFAHALLVKEGLLHHYFSNLEVFSVAGPDTNILSFCYYILSDNDYNHAKEVLDTALTCLLGEALQIGQQSQTEAAKLYVLVFMLFLLRIQHEQQALYNTMDDLADPGLQSNLFCDILAPFICPDGTQGPLYSSLDDLSQLSPVFPCVACISSAAGYSIYNTLSTVDRLLLVLRFQQIRLSFIEVRGLDTPTLPVFFSDAALAARAAGCSNICILSWESMKQAFVYTNTTPAAAYYALAVFFDKHGTLPDASLRDALGQQDGVIGEFTSLPDTAFPNGRSLMPRDNFILTGENPCCLTAALFHQRYLSVSPPFTAFEIFSTATRSMHDTSLCPDTSAPGIPAILLQSGITNLHAYASIINKENTELQYDDADPSAKQSTRAVLIHGKISLPETAEKRVAAVSKAILPFTTPLGVAAFIEKVYGEALTHRARIDTWKVPLPDIRQVFDRVRRYELAGSVHVAPPRLLRPTSQLPTSEQAEAALALAAE